MKDGYDKTLLGFSFVKHHHPKQAYAKPALRNLGRMSVVTKKTHKGGPDWDPGHTQKVHR